MCMCTFLIPVPILHPAHIAHTHVRAQGYAPRPAAKVVLPSPALLGPLALAWVGLAVARLAAGKK